MNALPGRMLVDVGAPDGARAAALHALCAGLGRSWYPRIEERAEAVGRQVLFTAWHQSGRARQRVSPEGPGRSLFGLEPDHVRAVVAVLVRPVYRHDLERFEARTGLGVEALRMPAEVLLEQAAGDDLLAAALAVEVYRLGGPLPSRTDPRFAAETWFSRWVLVRGPERERSRDLRIRAFSADAEHVLSLLRR